MAARSHRPTTPHGPTRPQAHRSAAGGRSRQHRRADTSRSAPSIPSTVWPCGPAPADSCGDVLAEQIITVCSRPGDALALLDTDPTTTDETGEHAHPHGGNTVVLSRAAERLDRHPHTLQPPATTPTGGTVPMPYWHGLPDADTDAHLAPSPAPAADETAGHGPAREPENRLVELVVATVGPDGADEHLGLLAASRLRTGGTLAVLTHSDTRGGRLVDPIGPIVASAQHADLLYLQHIIAVHAAITDATLQPASTDAPTETIHRRVHSDVLLFAQPTSTAL